MKALLSVLLLAMTALLPVLVDSAIKGTLLLVLAAACVLVYRGSSASTRHLVWLSALMGLLMMPLLSFALPKWRILPGWKQDEPSDTAGRASGSNLVYDAVPTVSTTAVEPLAEIGNAATPAPVWPLVGAVWCAGCSFFVGRLFVGARRLRRLDKAGASCGKVIAGTAGELARELGLRTKVRILLGPTACMPMTWGMRRPRILLPAEAPGWEVTRLRAVLLHELAHVKRRDTTTQLVVRLACALHWFNPLVWMAARRIELERERACDDLVLGHGVRASDYAENLLHIVGGNASIPLSHAGLPMARISTLEERLGAVLDERLNRRRLSRNVTGLLLVFGLAIVLPMAMLDAADDSKGEDVVALDDEGVASGTATEEFADVRESVEQLASMMEEHDQLKAKLARLLETYKEKSRVVMEMRARISRLEAAIVRERSEATPSDVAGGGVASLIAERIEWVKRRDELLQWCTEKHPRVRAANAHIGRLEAAIENAASEGEARRLGLPPEVLRKPIEEGNFAGLGVALSLAESGYPVIGNIIAEGAAAKAGTLRIGDEIRAVDLGGGRDWIDLQHMRLETVVRLLRGEPGTKIRLRIGKEDGTVEEQEIERQAMALPVPAEGLHEIEMKAVAVRSVSLRFVEASKVAATLAAEFPDDVAVAADARTNSIVLKGTRDALAPVLNRIKRLDSEKGDAGPGLKITLRVPKGGGEEGPEIDGKRLSQDELKDHIRGLDPRPAVATIFADKETPLTRVMEAVQTLKDCGIENVTFSQARSDAP